MTSRELRDDVECPLSDLPETMCAHCRGHKPEFPDYDETMIKVTGHGFVRRITRVPVVSDPRVRVGRAPIIIDFSEAS